MQSIKINRKKLFVGIGIFLLCASILSAFLIRERFLNHQTYTIVLTKNGFEPSTISIQRGDTVAFSTNRGFPFWPASDKHPSHSMYPEFDPKMPINQHDQWDFQFIKSGTWTFHDHLNSTLRGTIYVSN